MKSQNGLCTQHKREICSKLQIFRVPITKCWWYCLRIRVSCVRTVTVSGTTNEPLKNSYKFMRGNKRKVLLTDFCSRFSPHLPSYWFKRKCQNSTPYSTGNARYVCKDDWQNWRQMASFHEISSPQDKVGLRLSPFNMQETKTTLEAMAWILVLLTIPC